MSIRTLCTVFIGLLVATAVTACTHVRPYQRGRLADPAMQFEMGASAAEQMDTIVEILEGNTYPSAGPGSAGAGCGCH